MQINESTNSLCVNGHPCRIGAKFCNQCGAPVDPQFKPAAHETTGADGQNYDDENQSALSERRHSPNPRFKKSGLSIRQELQGELRPAAPLAARLIIFIVARDFVLRTGIDEILLFLPALILTIVIAVYSAKIILRILRRYDAWQPNFEITNIQAPQIGNANDVH